MIGIPPLFWRINRRLWTIQSLWVTRLTPANPAGGLFPSTLEAMQSRRPQLPPAALTWLLGERPLRVMAAAHGTAMPRLAADLGHDVHLVDKDFSATKRAAADARLTPCVARVEALPFEPRVFDVVLLHQVFHYFAPGLVLPEMARVLQPHGWVAASYLVRDDSVPWVRRLVDLMQSVDPAAMSGHFGDESIKALLSSKYFPVCDSRDFRVWVPINRRALVAMVASHPSVVALDEANREQLMRDAAAIHDIAASGSELRLPYQLKCWRAYVDQEELTTPIRLTDDALIIPL